MTDNTRTAEIADFDGHWSPISFQDIQNGDTFRLREETGELVDAGTEYEVCVALSNPYLNGAGVWTINAQPIAVGVAHKGQTP